MNFNFYIFTDYEFAVVNTNFYVAETASVLYVFDAYPVLGGGQLSSRKDSCFHCCC